MRLGVHTWCFNLHGIGQRGWAGFKVPWGRQMTTLQLLDKVVELGLDGVHLDDGSLQSLERSFLKEVGEAARERELFLEYNFSLDLGGRGVGTQHDLGEALVIAHTLGADVVKVGMDMDRPHPLAASRFHPDVVAQLESVGTLLRLHAPIAAEHGIRIAVENHTDVFSEELLWLLDQVDHPAVGVCLDTANAYHVTEDPSRRREPGPTGVHQSLSRRPSRHRAVGLPPHGVCGRRRRPRCCRDVLGVGREEGG